MQVMQIDLDQLPDAAAELKALLVQVVSDRDASLHANQRELKRQQLRIEQLEALLRRLQHARFGQRSEQHVGQGELALFNEAELLAGLAPAEEEPSITIPAHRRKLKGGRRALPPELARVDIVYDLPESEKSCPCGRTLEHIGDDILEQLAIIPLTFFVRRHIRRKYACACQGCIRTAPSPKQPLPGSRASAQLIAHIASAKFHDGLPLYRQEKMARREQVNLPRARQARWLIDVASLCQPLTNLLQDTLFEYDITASDDTGIQVLKEPGRSPSSHSYLWIRRGGPPDKPVVLVDYAPSRSAHTAQGLLAHCHGYLVCDAYPGYNRVMRANGLLPVYCNDHARRQFVEVVRSLKRSTRSSTEGLVAHRALEFYRRLYQLEKHSGQHDPLAHLQHRQLHALPLWEEFLAWAEQVQAAGVAHRETREALAYLLTHAEGLRRYCADGRLPISNIRSEHVAKTIALARKNFLFADTPAGAHASARLFGLLETAKANGHHPQRYLSVVFTDLPNATGLADYEALLPWNLSTDEVERRYAAFPKP